MEVRKYQKKMCHANVCHWYNVRFCYQSNIKHYPQILLEECKYEKKKNKMENLINDDFESSSSDESDNESEMSSKKSVND